MDPRKEGLYIYDYCGFIYKPYYIGKGKRGTNRKNHHINQSLNQNVDINKVSNKHFFYKNKKIINIGLIPIIVKLFENLSYNESIIIEKELINIIGRSDLNKGPLTNLTDGGEGLKNVTPEIREKLRILRLGKTYDEIYGKKISGRIKKQQSIFMLGNSFSIGNKLTLERKKQISIESKNRWENSEYRMKVVNATTLAIRTPESRKKSSDSKKGKNNYWFGKTLSYNHKLEVSKSKSKKWLIIYENGKTFIIDSLKKFCNKNNLNYNNIWSTSKSGNFHNNVRIEKILC